MWFKQMNMSAWFFNRIDTRLKVRADRADRA